ncbi:hypothetical protein [uncultured Cohaesibacter sp.]|uniref:hypothetical protein n=1 Tax=uncultured Cohaesibacter sp. TaxID=1002546 RepID=UPI0029C8D385|nr:hypothetical protein [uncultured Cohaesibacter sp.]
MSQYLLSDLLDANSDAAGAVTTLSYLESTQSSLGSLTDESGDGTSIANALSDFEEAMTTLAATPGEHQPCQFGGWVRLRT